MALGQKVAPRSRLSKGGVGDAVLKRTRAAMLNWSVFGAAEVGNSGSQLDQKSGRCMRDLPCRAPLGRMLFV